MITNSCLAASKPAIFPVCSAARLAWPLLALRQEMCPYVEVAEALEAKRLVGVPFPVALDCLLHAGTHPPVVQAPAPVVRPAHRGPRGDRHAAYPPSSASLVRGGAPPSCNIV